MGVAEVTPKPQLEWSPLFLLLFLVSVTCVSFVVLRLFRVNPNYELDIIRPPLVGKLSGTIYLTP
jgi:hypothetical protein